ncbi:MAG: glycosyltransferase [bacterium]|nr:glycosyltransferase [bacterium]
MQIEQVVESLEAWASGPAYSVPALCRSLARLQQAVTLHALGPFPAEREFEFEVKEYSVAGFPRILGASPTMKHELRSRAEQSQVIHSNGLWRMPCIYPGAAARRHDTALFVSPRGMLDPWAWDYHWVRKRIVWWLAQRANLARAACIHATATAEAECVRRVGIRTPITIVPNGIDVPPPEVLETPRSARRRLLFLARLHPKKGVDSLVRAWRQVQGAFADWELKIVGPDSAAHRPNSSYSSELQALARSLGAERIEFVGEIPESEKSSYIASADLYVLPTHAENWGISITEALAHAVPAIVTKGAPWEGLDSHRCGWWIDDSVEALVACLNTALGRPRDELAEMGRRGREWMERDLSWSSVGQRMLESYRWAVHGGSRPDWIHVH